MWGMLGLRRHFMIEFQSHFWYVFGHRDVYVPLSVVPFYEQPTIIFPFPVHCNVKFFSESIKEMVGVVDGKIFYAEIVNAEAETSLSSGMRP